MKIKLLSKANSAWFLLAGAAALAALMSFAVLRYLQDRERTLQEEVVAKAQGGPKVDVVVPMQDVPAGTVVSRDVFVSRPIDADLVYPDMVQPGEFDSYVDRKTLQPILRGRPLRVGDVDRADHPLALSIPMGYRAITISSDSSTSLSNMIRPGDIVDFYLLATPSESSQGAARGGSKGDVASLLLQKIPVLATGRRVFDKEERAAPRPADGTPLPGALEYDTLTLQASPDQAARVALALKVGSIRAVLRGSNDDGQIRSSTLAANELFPTDDPNEARMRSVQYIVGGQGDAAISDRAIPDIAGAITAARRNAAQAKAPAAPATDGNAVLTLAKPKPATNDSSLFFPQSTGGNRR